MVTDEEVQKTARKSALLVARLTDGTFRVEVLPNENENGSGYTSKQMFADTKTEIKFVQVREGWGIRALLSAVRFWLWTNIFFFTVALRWTIQPDLFYHPCCWPPRYRTRSPAALTSMKCPPPTRHTRSGPAVAPLRLPLEVPVGAGGSVAPLHLVPEVLAAALPTAAVGLPRPSWRGGGHPGLICNRPPPRSCRELRWLGIIRRI